MNVAVVIQYLHKPEEAVRPVVTCEARKQEKCDRHASGEGERVRKIKIRDKRH